MYNTTSQFNEIFEEIKEPPANFDNGPFAINGFYPLYDTENASNNAGDGTSHTHILNGIVYFMPNGITSYHGDYNDTNNSSEDTIEDTSGNTINDTSGNNTEDTTPPVVTLIGNASITIEKDTTYTEQGAVSDGGEAITIMENVNTNIVGTYTITYSATDAAGNTGSVTRTISVEDTISPVVTLIGNASITIEKDTTYTEQGAVSDGGEAITITGNVDTNIVGTYTITYSATDAAGNTGSVTRTIS